MTILLKSIQPFSGQGIYLPKKIANQRYLSRKPDISLGVLFTGAAENTSGAPPTPTLGN
jgi:hypothetical protein